MTVTVSLDTSEATRAIRALKNRAPKAIVRAINRSAESAKTAVSREIARDMKAKVGAVKDRISIIKAREGTAKASHRYAATLYASTKRLPLYAMGARGPYPSRGKGRGVTARTPQRRYPNAFLAQMRSGHMGVFTRTSRRRLPVVELMYVSIWKVFDKFKHVAVARGYEQLAKNLKHELRFAARQS